MEEAAKASDAATEGCACTSLTFLLHPTQHELLQLRQSDPHVPNEERHKTAVALFNADPADGVRFMRENRLVFPTGSTTALLKHLVSCRTIDRAMLGKYVTQSELWEEFVLLFDFMHRTLDNALRTLLCAVVLPPLEGRKKAVLAFVDQYCFHNAHDAVLRDPVRVFPIVTALLRLNDALSARAPSPNEFVEWCRVSLEAINVESFAEEVEFRRIEGLLLGLYSRVRHRPFVVDVERQKRLCFDLPEVKAAKSFSIDKYDIRGWLWLSEHVVYRDKRIQDKTWSRYFVVLSDWVLYVFEDAPEETFYGNGNPYCIIPLLDSYPMHGLDVDSLTIKSDHGMRVFHPSCTGSGVMETHVIHLRADDIETLDRWYQTLRSKHIHPSARAIAEFSQYLETIKSKVASPNSIRNALKWPRALSPTADNLIFRVIPPDALQGYVLLRRKSQQYAYKKFCVLIDGKLYYANDKQDCKKDSRFRGYIDLCAAHTLDSTVSKGAWKYVIHLKDKTNARVCNIGLPTAKEFSLWLRALTELCAIAKRIESPPQDEVKAPQAPPPSTDSVSYDSSSNGHNGAAFQPSPPSVQAEASTENSPTVKPTIKPPVPPPMAPSDHVKKIPAEQGPVPPSIPPPMVPPG